MEANPAVAGRKRRLNDRAILRKVVITAPRTRRRPARSEHKTAKRQSSRTATRTYERAAESLEKISVQEEAILIGISQLAAVFAGFIAIFMAFVQSESKFSAADAIRARVILFSSFVVVLASILPLIVHGLGAPPEWTWRIAMGVYLVFGAFISVDVIRRLGALPKPEAPVRKFNSILSRALNLTIFVLGALVLVGVGQGGVYILALVVNLTLASVSFLSFATERLQ